MRRLAHPPIEHPDTGTIADEFMVGNRADEDAAKVHDVPDTQAFYEQTAERHYRLARQLVRDAQHDLKPTKESNHEHHRDTHGQPR